jgi:hypothetical protein
MFIDYSKESDICNGNIRYIDINNNETRRKLLFFIQREVGRDTRLKGKCGHLLQFLIQKLYKSFNNEGLFSYEVFQKQFQKSYSTIGRYIKQLEELGYLKITGTKNNMGYRHNNKYAILVPPDMAKRYLEECHDFGNQRVSQTVKNDIAGSVKNKSTGTIKNDRTKTYNNNNNNNNNYNPPQEVQSPSLEPVVVSSVNVSGEDLISDEPPLSMTSEISVVVNDELNKLEERIKQQQALTNELEKEWINEIDKTTQLSLMDKWHDSCAYLEHLKSELENKNNQIINEQKIQKTIDEINTNPNYVNNLVKEKALPQSAIHLVNEKLKSKCLPEEEINLMTNQLAMELTIGSFSEEKMRVKGLDDRIGIALSLLDKNKFSARNFNERLQELRSKNDKNNTPISSVS